MKPFFQTFTTFHALQNAWRVVRAKKSAGGIDGFSVAAFEKNLADNLHLLRHELLTEQWNPEPYLKVEIEKAGKAEKRKLGLSFSETLLPGILLPLGSGALSVKPESR